MLGTLLGGRFMRRIAFLAFALTSSAGLVTAIVLLGTPSNQRALLIAPVHKHRATAKVRPYPIPNAPVPCKCAKTLPPFRGVLRPLIIGGTGTSAGRLYLGQTPIAPR